MIENIDIGGPTLIRAAAKNHALRGGRGAPGELRRRPRGAAGGATGACRRRRASRSRPRRSARTARYDAAISRWFAEREEDFPQPLRGRVREGARSLLRREPAPARRLLRAGRDAHATCWPARCKMHGKELSFNNLLDLDSGAAPAARVRAAGLRDRQAQQPVRRARVGETAPRPTSSALACDPASAFGGVVAFNREVDRRAGRARSTRASSSCSSPPATSDDALEIAPARSRTSA